VQRLLGIDQDRVLRVVLMDLHRTRARIRQLQQQQSGASQSQGKKKKAAVVSATISSELLLLHHRLQCCMTLIENLSSTSAPFSSICSMQLQTDNSGALSAMQLLFDILTDYLPNMQLRQQPNPPETAPMQLLLPSADSHPIAPLLTLMRLFCNGTNRNDAGVTSVNQQYSVAGQQEVSLLGSLRSSLDAFRFLTLPLLIDVLRLSELFRSYSGPASSRLRTLVSARFTFGEPPRTLQLDDLCSPCARQQRGGE
jgi:hypothetical protein